MRGQQSLFAQFFGNTQIQVKEQQRPRNFYMPERNKMLVYRYYFYMKIKCYQYFQCLEELEKDLFLTDVTLAKLLAANDELLTKVVTEEMPTVQQLKSMFPRYNWNI